MQMIFFNFFPVICVCQFCKQRNYYDIQKFIAYFSLLPYVFYKLNAF